MSSLNSSPNVKGVAPLPASADVENKQEPQATQDHDNSGAGSGCPLPSCSDSFFSSDEYGPGDGITSKVVIYRHEGLIYRMDCTPSHEYDEELIHLGEENYAARRDLLVNGIARHVQQVPAATILACRPSQDARRTLLAPHVHRGMGLAFHIVEAPLEAPPNALENARLIADSPKFLAACQMMNKCHGSTEWAMSQLSIREREAIQAIRAAIAESLWQNVQTEGPAA